MDGKTLRGIYSEQLPGVHLVAAYAHQSGIVVGQQRVGEKQNELRALPGLLDQLDLRGLVITGDAQFTQRKECRLITEKRGHYFLTVKDNQPILKDDISTIWEAELPSLPDAAQTNKHGGRVEKRELWVSDILVGYSDWPFLAQVCRLERTVTRKGKTSQEVAFAVTSLSPQEADATQLLTFWRGHWGIENRVHWVRDVTLGEDRCQVRTGAAPQVMATLRNMIISLIRRDGKPNIAAALRRHAAHPAEALALVGARLG